MIDFNIVNERLATAKEIVSHLRRTLEDDNLIHTVAETGHSKHMRIGGIDSGYCVVGGAGGMYLVSVKAAFTTASRMLELGPYNIMVYDPGGDHVTQAAREASSALEAVIASRIGGEHIDLLIVDGPLLDPPTLSTSEIAKQLVKRVLKLSGVGIEQGVNVHVLRAKVFSRLKREGVSIVGYVKRVSSSLLAEIVKATGFNDLELLLALRNSLDKDLVIGPLSPEKRYDVFKLYGVNVKTFFVVTRLKCVRLDVVAEDALHVASIVASEVRSGLHPLIVRAADALVKRSCKDVEALYRIALARMASRDKFLATLLSYAEWGRFETGE